MKMKHMIYGLVAAISLSAGVANAEVSSQSMSYLKSQNWVSAEASLKNDLNQNNQDPKVWYDLAQVLNHEHKPQEAMKALNNAVHLDKTMSFARSRQTVLNLRDVIQHNIGVVQGSAQTSVPAVSYAPRQQVQTSTPTTHTYAPQSESHKSSGHGGLIFVIILLLIAAGVGVFFFLKKSKKQDDSQQDQKLVKLDEMFNDVSQKVDFIKATGKSSTSLGIKMANLKSSLLSAKASGNVSDYEFGELKSEYTQLVNRFDTDDYDAPVPPAQPVQQSVPQQPTQYQDDQYNRPQRHSHSYDDSDRRVVVNNYGSNDSGSGLGGFTTGLVMGELLSDRHEDHETIIEREPVIEREPEEYRPSPRDDYEEPSDDFSNDNDDDQIQQFAGDSASDWGDQQDDYEEPSDDFADDNDNDDDDDFS